MSDTGNLGLALVQPAQAQKHVTVNEALVRIDGLAQLVIQSVDTLNPPLFAPDGEVWAVPAGATGAWVGHDGDVAIWSTGGWVFAQARQGWRAWIADRSAHGVFDGVGWQASAVALGSFGAATRQAVVETLHTVGAGPVSTIAGAIPAHSILLGVTAHVVADVTGAAVTWRLGTSADDAQFGSGLGLAAGSWARGLLSSPTAYYADTDILLTGEGGDLAGGSVRIGVHAMHLDHPTS